MIKEEVVRRKKSSRFLSGLGFFVFLLVLISVGLLGVTYVYRDRLILEYVRDMGPKGLGLEVLAVDSLLTRPIGQISAEVRGLVFRSSPQAPLLRAERVLISTPKNLLGLYQLTFTRQALPLKIQMSGLQVQTFPDDGSAATSAAKNDLALGTAGTKPLVFPFPVDLETEFRDAQIFIGRTDKPFTIRNLTGLARTTLAANPNGTTLTVKSSGQLSMGLGLGGGNFLPIRTDWTLQAEPQLAKASDFAIQITSLTVSTLGMNLKSSGSLKWPEQSFAINMSGSTTDLGVLPLDAAEAEALGLTGRLKGAADLDIKTSGTLNGLISSRGLLRVRQGVFPFTIKSTKEKPLSVKGPVQIEVEAPFDISFDMGTNSIKDLKLQAARFDIDLTDAEVNVDGMLRKPAALMMALKTEFNALGDTVDISRAEFRLANFLARTAGKISMDPKRNSDLEITATLPSLNGWPGLLPVLGQPAQQGTPTERINLAKGSFALKARAELPLSQPDKIKTASKVDFETFEASGIEYPLNMPLASGILRGTISAAGSIELTDSTVTPMRWNLRRSKGFFDLSHLAVEWKDVFSKQRSQTASVEFAIQGQESTTASHTRQIQVDRFDLKLLDSTMSVKGMFRDLNRPTGTPQPDSSYGADAKVISRIALSQAYIALPSLRSFRSQIPTGTLTSNLNIKGTLRLAPNTNPLERSPLTLSGTVGLIAPRAILLVAAPAAKTTAPPPGQETTAPASPTFFKWPVFKLANIKSDIQFSSIALTTSEAKGFKANTHLSQGLLKGTATIASLFDGAVTIDSFSSNLEPMTATAQGSYRDINLSMLGEYFDPKWKSAVGGKSTGRFKFEKTASKPEKAATASMLDVVSVSGSMNVKDGFFSTASIDQMVNQKLSEFPQIAKLVGIKQKIKTGGARVDMSTNYVFAKSTLTVKSLLLKSPEKNEVALDGWIKPDLSVDLVGKAFLMDSSIGGSFRQANSDASGRLVVPIRLTGSLATPSISMAQDIVNEMVGKTVRLETNKATKAVEKVLDKKKNEAIDAVKEELKKRGLSF